MWNKTIFTLYIDYDGKQIVNFMRKTLDTSLNQKHFILLSMYRIYFITNKKVVSLINDKHETSVQQGGTTNK